MRTASYGSVERTWWRPVCRLLAGGGLAVASAVALGVGSLVSTPLPGGPPESQVQPTPLAPPVRVTVQLAATPRTAATGVPHADAARELEVGSAFTAFLAAGEAEDLCQLATVPGLSADSGFRYHWRVDVRLVAVETESIELDVAWRRLERSGTEWQLTGGDRRSLLLREHEEHLLDFVAADAASTSVCRNVVLRLGASIVESPRFARTLLAYDLWLVQEGADGRQRTQRLQAIRRSGEPMTFRFRPLRWSWSGDELDGGFSGAVEMNVSGDARGRLRADGTVEVALRTARELSHGSRSVIGGGQKRFVMRQDETIGLELPPASGSAEDRAGLSEARAASRLARGVILTTDTARVDFTDFFEGAKTVLLLTVHQEW